MHVHTAGIGAGNSGCFVSASLQNSYKFGFYLRAFGVSESDLRNEDDGVVDETRTQVYVPNDFVWQETNRYPALLYGASINPYRLDALERLTAAHANGAVSIKWIPAIMDIDPADPKISPFYQALAELKLPLLIHVG